MHSVKKESDKKNKKNIETALNANTMRGDHHAAETEASTPVWAARRAPQKGQHAWEHLMHLLSSYGSAEGAGGQWAPCSGGQTSPFCRQAKFGPGLGAALGGA